MNLRQKVKQSKTIINSISQALLFHPDTNLITRYRMLAEGSNVPTRSLVVTPHKFDGVQFFNLINTVFNLTKN